MCGVTCYLFIVSNSNRMYDTWFCWAQGKYGKPCYPTIKAIFVQVLQWTDEHIIHLCTCVNRVGSSVHTAAPCTCITGNVQCSGLLVVILSRGEGAKNLQPQNL